MCKKSVARASGVLASVLLSFSSANAALQPPNCVHEQPFDGYSFQLPDTGPTNTTSEIAQVQANYDHYFHQTRDIQPALRRYVIPDAEPITVPVPECFLHAPGRPTRGTVLIFHGFNAEPHQQHRLAAYLFHQGFNVYSPYLAHHEFHAGEYWAKTRYRANSVALLESQSLLKKLTSLVPFSQSIEDLLLLALQAGPKNPLTSGLQSFIAKQRYSSVETILTAFENPESAEFNRLFQGSGRTYNAPSLDGSYQDYITDALERYADIRALSGPIYLDGLSVGAVAALAVGEMNPDHRIAGIVAHAPFIAGSTLPAQLVAKLIGPTDKIHFAFSPDSPKFNLSNVAAIHSLGSWIKQSDRLARLAQIPTFLVMSEVDNTANLAEIRNLQSELQSHSPPGVAHELFSYSADKNVGHAFVDPENYPNVLIPQKKGGGWNHYWKSLYQENFRFLAEGKINRANLNALTPDPTLPGPSLHLFIR